MPKRIAVSSNTENLFSVKDVHNFARLSTEKTRMLAGEQGKDLLMLIFASTIPFENAAVVKASVRKKFLHNLQDFVRAVAEIITPQEADLLLYTLTTTINPDLTQNMAQIVANICTGTLTQDDKPAYLLQILDKSLNKHTATGVALSDSHERINRNLFKDETSIVVKRTKVEVRITSGVNRYTLLGNSTQPVENDGLFIGHQDENNNGPKIIF